MAPSSAYTLSDFLGFSYEMPYWTKETKMHQKVNVQTHWRGLIALIFVFIFCCLSLSIKKQGQTADLCEYDTEISFHKIRVIAWLTE
jgi:hypothetical protein